VAWTSVHVWVPGGRNDDRGRDYVVFAWRKPVSSRNMATGV